MNDYLSPDRLFQILLLSVIVSIALNVGLPLLIARWQGVDSSEAEPLPTYLVVYLSLFWGAAIGLLL